MARSDELKRTVAWTLVFFTLLFVLSYLQNTYSSAVTIDPTLILAALVPILLFFVASGQLKRFSGGGFEIVFREQAQKLVSSNRIDVEKAEIGPNALADEIPNIRRKSPDALVFRLGNSVYSDEVIREYLDRVQSLKYIVFTDTDGSFEGYIPVEDFDGLVAEAGSEDQLFEQYAKDDTPDISSEIQNRTVLSHEPVLRASIEDGRSNEEALKKMTAEGVDKLPVVDSNGEFVGVVTQDEIVRNILTGVITESTS